MWSNKIIAVATICILLSMIFISSSTHAKLFGNGIITKTIKKFHTKNSVKPAHHMKVFSSFYKLYPPHKYDSSGRYSMRHPSKTLRGGFYWENPRKDGIIKAIQIGGTAYPKLPFRGITLSNGARIGVYLNPSYAFKKYSTHWLQPPNLPH